MKQKSVVDEYESERRALADNNMLPSILRRRRDDG